jgi:hypothetical protein
MMPNDNQSQHGHEDGHRQSGWIEQKVEQQNVDDNGSKQRQSERHESSSQAERAADYLQRSHHIKEVADEQGLGEVTGRTAWRRRHVKELQENVQSEKDEHATHDDSSNGSGDFHKMSAVSSDMR